MPLYRSVAAERDDDDGADRPGIPEEPVTDYFQLALSPAGATKNKTIAARSGSSDTIEKKI